jgi:DNA-binding transcriptional MerR regulator
MASYDDDRPGPAPLRPEPSGAGGNRRAASTSGRTPPIGRTSRPPARVPRYRYEISELEEETGIPIRTIRYYISRGLLAPAYGRGPSATYDLGHLLRLRLIARLKDERHPLEEIRDRLGEMSDSDVEAALGIQVAPPTDTWRRITLHDDIELHIRVQPAGANSDAFNEAVELIVGLAQPVIDRLE